MTVSRAPAGGPRHLLDLLLDRGGDGGVADVGVDLHQEPAADDHRLGLGMVDVRGDDGAAAGDLVAHDLGVHALAQGHELHLRGDLAAPRVVHLGHAASRLGAQAPAAARARLHVVALEDPVAPQRRQALLEVGRVARVGVGAARVVEADALAGRRARPRGTGRGPTDRSRRDRSSVEASLRWHYPGQVCSGRQRLAALSARISELPRGNGCLDATSKAPDGQDTEKAAVYHLGGAGRRYRARASSTISVMVPGCVRPEARAARMNSAPECR